MREAAFADGVEIGIFCDVGMSLVLSYDPLEFAGR